MNEPFSIVKNKYVRKNTNLAPISVKTVMKYLQRTHILVERKLSIMLPDKFGLVFDGWTCDGMSDHYIAIFAMWSKENEAGVTRVLLCCGPQEQPDENDLPGIEFTAADIGDHIINQLRVFNKTLANVDCLVCDNCAVNRKLAELMEKPMVGCYSHRLNLAIANIFCDQTGLSTIIERIDLLMKDLRTLKNASLLVAQRTNIKSRKEEM